MPNEPSGQRTVLGIDLGATNVRVARISGQNIEKLESEKIRDGHTPDILLNQISQIIERLITPEVDGIGMGAPSVVDVENGIVYDVVNIPSWEEVHVKSIFEDRFGVPLRVNNDANCFALGEKYFGKGQTCKSMVGMVIGSGLGSGLVLDGKPYYGPNCGAGEVGMMPYLDGIVENYASGQFFERRDVQGEEVFRRAQEGDKEALEMYSEFGGHFGKAVMIVLYGYDPELIVLGGSIREAYPYFKDSMFRVLNEEFAYPQSLEKLKIELSEHEHIAVLGAAALSLAQ